MKEQDIINKLKKEFKEVYTWEDKPNRSYEKHSHEWDTKIIIISGDISIKIDGKEFTLKRGDSIYIEKNKTHKAKTGQTGCKYIVGEITK
ncbi:MAG: cupin domain-containing protein [Nanoarchaeota archaeon]